MLCTIGTFAQNLQDVSYQSTPTDTNFDSLSTNLDTPPISIGESFEEAAEKNGIAYRTFSDLEGVENGYYIVSGVFGNDKNLEKTIKKLRKKGFDKAGAIVNSNNGLSYLYLDYFPFGLEAVDACVSNMEGKHKDEKWILEVENSLDIGGNNIPPQTIETLEVNSISTFNDSHEVASKPLDKTVSKTKLLERADHYFDKMWYAEAAELYEDALSKGDKFRSKEIIEKAADSYYFNTNMEKAYEWYNVLYENYGEELSADNIFKYSHALKGTGKYARSKRLMKLYDKKVKEEGLDKPRIERREMVLDNILESEREMELKNLAINTKYSDFSPPMFLDSNQVVFASAKDSSFLSTRRYKWNNQPYLDLYVAKINEEDEDLKDAIKFSKKINTKYHEASVTFSPDNKTMYFTRNNYGKKLKRDKKGMNHLKIYRSIKANGEWAEAQEVSFNSDDYSTGTQH